MDPVSRIILQRESNLPDFTPWIILAILLHTGLALAALFASTITPRRPHHLPSVSVRIVHPQAVAPRRRRPAPAAQPQRAPEPQHKAVAEPPPPPPAQPKASDKAMAAIEADDDKKQPTPQPATDDAGAALGPPSGLSLADEGGGSDLALPSDFQFAYYVDRMLALVQSKWYKPPVPPGTAAQVRFVITSSGRIEGIRLEQSSQVPTFDRAVLRALYAANPLPPLPPAYKKPTLTVHLSFAE